MFMERTHKSWRHFSALGWSEERVDQEIPGPVRAVIDANRAGTSFALNSLDLTDEGQGRMHARLLTDEFGMPVECSERQLDDKIVRKLIFDYSKDVMRALFAEVNLARDTVSFMARDYMLRKISPEEFRSALSSHSDLPVCSDLEDRVLDRLMNRQLSKMSVSLDEAFNNHIEHGAKWDPRFRIAGKARIVNGVLDVFTADAGEGFDEAAVPCTSEGVPSGRGLPIMRAFARLEVHSGGRGNKLSIDLDALAQAYPWQEALDDMLHLVRDDLMQQQASRENSNAPLVS